MTNGSWLDHHLLQIIGLPTNERTSVVDRHKTHDALDALLSAVNDETFLMQGRSQNAAEFVPIATSKEETELRIGGPLFRNSIIFSRYSSAPLADWLAWIRQGLFVQATARILHDTPHHPDSSSAASGVSQLIGNTVILDALKSQIAEPLAKLSEDTAQKLGLNQGNSPEVVLWLSSNGSVSNTHYDRSANVVLQVEGHKKWRLWPPAAWHILLYPWLHPSHQQAQEQSKDHLESSGASEVELKPGDVLFVPPFWLHEVTTTAPAAQHAETLPIAISLSVLSPSVEEVQAAAARWRLMRTLAPHRRKWNAQQRLVVALVVLEGMLGVPAGHPSAVLTGRPATVSQPHFGPSLLRLLQRIEQRYATSVSAEVTSMIPIVPLCLRELQPHAAALARTAEVQKALAATTEVLASMAAGAWLITVQNLGEELLRFATGALQIYPWLHACVRPENPDADIQQCHLAPST